MAWSFRATPGTLWLRLASPGTPTGPLGQAITSGVGDSSTALDASEKSDCGGLSHEPLSWDVLTWPSSPCGQSQAPLSLAETR